ncbi:helix-turn-helix domain-containing protein [Pontiellaceae bacterium B1224]|nr:helix-turn-helix domain-containing protein [Pontiellaceae bacterium B1224]
MKIERVVSDEAVLQELGRRLTQRRLELQLTQADLAEQAGVSKRTVERIEAGATSQLLTMIRILRVLELLDRLDQLIPETGPRPMDLIKLKGKERQRAPRKKKTSDDHSWKWGDES